MLLSGERESMDGSCAPSSTGTSNSWVRRRELFCEAMRPAPYPHAALIGSAGLAGVPPFPWFARSALADRILELREQSH